MTELTQNRPAVFAAAFPPTRIAVSAMFFMNGYVVGNWAPKIPVFAGRLGLSEFALGLMILGFGIGSLIAMPIFGALIARNGSAGLTRLGALVVAPALLLITLAPTITVATVTVFLLGAVIGGMDVAMNANAVAVERMMRRPIMSSCHGFWSLGGLVGALSGGILIESMGVTGQALVVLIVSLAVIAVVWRSVLQDRPQAGEESGLSAALPKNILPYLLGLVALFCMVPEGAVLDWGALYLRQELGADVVLSGLAFGAFSATMAVMRFAGDAVRSRLGAVLTLRLCTALAFVGLVAAGLAPNAIVAVIGFAVAGIGISNMVPIAFSAAGNLPGLAPGIGLSVVTFMGYSGILAAPSVIGFVAEYTGFAVIFAVLPLFFVVVLALSGLARHADMQDDS